MNDNLPTDPTNPTEGKPIPENPAEVPSEAKPETHALHALEAIVAETSALAAPPPAIETPAIAPAAEAVSAPAETPAVEEAPVPVELPVEEDTRSDFEKMMEAYEQKISNLHPGSYVQGKIVKIQDNEVFVDLSCTRCEGTFPAEEIKDAKGNLLFAEGDAIDVQVLSDPNSDTTIKLSYKNARRQDLIRKFKRAFEDGTPVTGLITESIKGGMKVQIEGFEAFLPASQIDLRYVENTDLYIGRTERFRIEKFNAKQAKLVVSRRKILEVEKEQARKDIWEKLVVGQVVVGKVTRLTGYGVFVDLGGVEGLIHISNLSWDKVKKPSEIVKAGDEISVQVIELDPEKERIGLGLKQMVEDPWLSIDRRYVVGQRVRGKVEKLESFGAFAKLEPGVTGLIPISEMSWTRRINHPSEIMKIGDEVETIVLRVDPAERKISLSLKQINLSPFAQFAETYKPGDVLEGEVTNVVGYGAFVKLENNIEGLMHISEISWTSVRNIDDHVRKGDKISVRIISINPETEKISLSAKMGEPPQRDEPRPPEEAGDRGARTGDRFRKGGRKPGSRDRDGEDNRYILSDAPAAAAKLGEMFPKELLDKMKPKRSN